MNRKDKKENIIVSLPITEKQRLKDMADKSGLVFSEFIRITLEGAKIMRLTPLQ